MRRHDVRCGAALLESIVALAILALAGIAALQLGTESSRAIEAARSTDATVARASALLDAIVLWPGTDLDRNIGDRTIAGFRVSITRRQALYEVMLTDDANNRVLLETVVYRRSVLGSSAGVR